MVHRLKTPDVDVLNTKLTKVHESICSVSYDLPNDVINNS